MSQVTVRIDIDAPPEVVYDAMLDPGRLDRWVTIHKRVNRADDGPLCEGYTMEQTLVLRGAPFKVRWTLTHYDRPTTATWEGKGPGGSYARTTYRLAPADGNGTCFEYENEYKAPGGILGAAASRALVGGTSEREARASLERLKRLLEG
ncbi:MAG: SRPBCC family protein [Actinomycetota bacterium]|nr:SRPBCC family protein [Actinomycetota bacterium]